ncbi:MAG: LamG domain-containing protein, partial [Pseudomonadota bacterium]
MNYSRCSGSGLLVCVRYLRCHPEIYWKKQLPLFTQKLQTLLMSLCLALLFVSPASAIELISSGQFNAVEERPDGSMYTNSSDLELMHDTHTGGIQRVGIRWESAAIPSGVTITSAHVVFDVDEPNSGATSVVIRGVDQDNAGQFGTANNTLTNIVKTSASANWDSIPAWTAIHSKQNTVDLSAIIQEIIDRPGWASGNGIALVFESGTGCNSNSCRRTAESNSNSSYAPKLVVNFTVTLPPPIADLHLDKGVWTGSAGEVNDNSPSPTHGTAIGGANTVLSGKVCRAGRFDGSNDYISISSVDTVLQATGSLSFWIKTTQTGDNTGWRAPGVSGVEQAGGGDDIFWGWIDASGHIGLSVGNDYGTDTRSTSAINDDSWHHVVLTRNHSSGTTAIYVDGVLENSKTAGTGAIGNAFASIGRIEDTGSTPEYFQGQLDEVLLFDSVLNADQVTAIFTNQNAGNNYDGSARTCPAPPIAEWRFDELNWDGTSGELTDTVGSFDGQAVGGTLSEDAQICRGATFDGVDDHFTLPSIANDFTSGFAATAWVDFGTTQNWERVFDFGNGAGNNNILLTRNGNSNNLTFEVYHGGSCGKITAANGIQSGLHHYAVSMASDRSVSLYRDGQLIASGTSSCMPANVTRSTNYIGRSLWSFDGYFDNQIDELKIFDRDLSADQVSSIYANESAGNNYDGSARLCPAEIELEAGQVILPDTSATPAFTAVTFGETFTVTPLVFTLPTNDGTDPAALRIRNVTTNGFEIAYTEPQGENATHPGGTVDWFAIKPGDHELDDGTRLLAGSVSTSRIQGRMASGSKSWETISFAPAFAATPAVLAMIQTAASESGTPPAGVSEPWMSTAIRNVGTSSMNLALERAETSTGTVAAETIAYLAMDAGRQGTLVDNITYETIRSADNIRGWGTCSTVGFTGSYSAEPLVIATQNRRDGGDGGWVRRCGLTTGQVGLTIDEDRARDNERNHTTESAGILVISSATHDTLPPIAEWRFDENSWNGTAGELIDNLGSLDGQASGGTLSQDAQICRGATFDGVDDHFVLPSIATDFASGFSASAWVDFGSAQSWERVFDFGNGAGNNNILLARHSNTNNLTFEIYNGGSCGQITAINGIQPGRQHYAVAMAADRSVSLYRNGQVIVSGTSTCMPASVT